MASTITVAERGQARVPLILQEEATDSERHAVVELAHHLQKITGARFETLTADTLPPSGIVVGQGKLARLLCPDVDWDKMNPEEVVIRTQGRHLLIAGGRPRGTLYAVYRFLHTVGGVRWWTPWASEIPQRRTFRVPPQNLREKPAFEYREPFWYHAFHPDWAVRNYSNGHHPNLAEKHGGKVVYVGFVHTFYALVPPETYFEKHPEWYSLIGGKRQWEKAQLCCTNPELREFLVGRVRQVLQENPQAQIISISQNDWTGACECPRCKAVDEREGTPAGSVLEMVNYIAERLEREFPQVAFDTLAYWYTRKPTRTLRPRPSVIIRLCSIECSFAEPLEAPINKAFADDIRGWSERSQRLYIWDYATNFTNYLSPHPNWYVLAPNLRFFHKHGVRGVFEQGSYQSNGGDMAELKAWLTAQLMWNPYQDERKLIDEFLRGYYGAAAPHIRRYMNLLSERARGFHMGCFTDPTKAPYLRHEVLVEAERLWERAERAVEGDPERLWRVQTSRVWVWYAWLKLWDLLQQQAREANRPWGMPYSKRELAQMWLQRATRPGPEGWEPIVHLNEVWEADKIYTPQKFYNDLTKNE